MGEELKAFGVQVHRVKVKVQWVLYVRAGG